MSFSKVTKVIYLQIEMNLQFLQNEIGIRRIDLMNCPKIRF